MAAFELPAVEFLKQTIEEEYPDLDVRPGSVLYELLVKPAAVMIQPLRDALNTTKRQLSISNASLMTAAQMNELAANYFLTRRTGDQATGTVRVYLSDATAVTFAVTAVFSTSGGLNFNPSSAQTFTTATILAQHDPTYGYYVNVAVEAELTGVTYNIDEHEINSFSLCPATVTSVDNLTPTSAGTIDDTNEIMAQRLENAVTTRTPINAASISTIVRENFTVDNVAVIGYGDTEMIRDTISVLTRLAETANGSDGYHTASATQFRSTAIVDWAAEGVYVGCQLQITSGDPDDIGTHTITGVTYGYLETDHTWAATGSSINWIVNGYRTNTDFHAGGKIDVYVDAARTTNTYILTVGSRSNSLASLAHPIFRITEVRYLETPSGPESATYSPLVEGRDYSLNIIDHGSWYSSDELILLDLLQTDSLASDPHYYAVGSSLEIEYETIAAVSSVDAYLQDSSRKVANADLLTKTPVPAVVTTSLTGMDDEITAYLATLSLGAELTKSGLISYLIGQGETINVSTFSWTVSIYRPDETIIPLVSGADSVQLLNNEKAIYGS